MSLLIMTWLNVVGANKVMLFWFIVALSPLIVLLIMMSFSVMVFDTPAVFTTVTPLYPNDE